MQIENALYIVPTPIGNLEDITQRAINIFGNADIVACEDTRTTGKLLKLLNITHNKMTSLHQHNESSKAASLVEEIINGKSVALASDAGTPGISDPGYRVITAAIEAGVKIVPLPGATAFIPALVASGFPNHHFTFFGFPPQKKGRKTFFEMVCAHPFTSILYESPHKIVKTLDLLTASIPDRQICIAREISKAFEEFVMGSPSECLEVFTNKQPKGEFVIVISSPESK